MATDFTNPQGVGTVQADGFTSPAVAGAPGQAPAAAQFPQGAALAGLALLSGGIKLPPVQSLVAAGASQGTATLVTSFVAIATVSLTSEGVRMIAAATGLWRFLFNASAVTLRAYPFLHRFFDAGASNADIVIAAHKGVMFMAKGDGKTWVTLKGA